MKQDDLLYKFVKDAKYYSIVYENKDDEEFGKIIMKDELLELDLSCNEIHRSIDYRNGDKLFVIDFINESSKYIDNSLQLLQNTISDARVIEEVYPKIFTWVFDGLCVKGYAVVPSGRPLSHPTISRYGGTDNFIRILRQHLKNITKMQKGKVPDFNFMNLNDKIKDTEISIGSFNNRTKNYSIVIDLDSNWKKILDNSNECLSNPIELSIFNMKFWTKEVNPDFIAEAKHVKLNNPLKVKGKDIKEIFDLYPAPIKRLMNLPNKGNYNRFLLVRFLLSVHAQDDAKFIYYLILGSNPEELEHVRSGNCNTQWNYVLNNLEKYDCPSMKELKMFIKNEDEKLSHPLEKIQEYLEREKNKDNEELEW